MKELKFALSAMGQNPSDEELAAMIKSVDDDGSGEIEFTEFLKVIELNKEAAGDSDENDTVDAFVAMGGNPDKSGQVSTDKLRATVRAFELTLDIEKLIDEVDKDGSGFLDYSEFRMIMN